MKFVLQLVLALLIVVGGSPTGASARVSTPAPCEHTMASAGSSVDDCGVPGTAKTDHGLCLAASSGCCAFVQVHGTAVSPRVSAKTIVWTIGAERRPIGRTFAPATPPPRA